MMPKDADVISSRHNAKSRLYVFIHGMTLRQTGSGYVCVDLVFVLVQHSSCLQLHSYISGLCLEPSVRGRKAQRLYTGYACILSSTIHCYSAKVLALARLRSPIILFF